MPTARKIKDLDPYSCAVQAMPLDLSSAKEVEIYRVKRRSGKHQLWINVDGVCVLRIQNVTSIKQRGDR